MAVDIGPKIGIQGEKEFRQEISNVNQSLKTLAAEQKAVTSSFDAETDAEKKAAAQKEVLAKQIDAQKDKLDLLEKGLRESAQMYGEADTKTLKWQQAVHEATAQLNSMEKQLGDVDKNVDETSASMDDASEATSGWADAMKGQLLGDAIKAGLQKLADLAMSAASTFWDASKAGAAYADDILTLAETTGLSTDELQEYKYMAALVDVELETLTSSMTKLTSNIAKAAEGDGEAAEAFRELGVSVTDSNGNMRKAKDVFRDAINALGKVRNETDRDAKAMKIFGKSAKDLNPMISAGADKLEKLGKEAHNTGYVLSGSALSALGKQQDAMDKMSAKVEALRNNFAAKLAPGMTKAYETIGEAADNPRVKRSLDLIAEGIGNVISKAADLAAKALPNIVAFLTGDDRLRLYSDAELLLAENADKAAESYSTMVATFTENAKTIVSEKVRTEKLWKELQKLVDENGFVKQGYEERVDYILNELSQALGIEYRRTGAVIKQYQNMRAELDNIIRQKAAEQLLEAGQDNYTQALADRNEALETAGQLYENLQEAIDAAAAAQEAYDTKFAKGEELRNNNQLKVDLWKYVAEERVALNDAKTRVKTLSEDYNKASEAAKGFYEITYSYETAKEQYLQGNYATTIHLLSDEFIATLDYYKKKKKLSDQEIIDLREKTKKQKSAIAEYKRNLEAGLAGFSEAGLQELEAYVAEAEKILDDSEKASENGRKTGEGWLRGIASTAIGAKESGVEVGGNYVEGITEGLQDPTLNAELEAAAESVAKKVDKVTRALLYIKSPSRLAKWIGEMWDKGLIEGLEAREKQVERASASLAETVSTAGRPIGATYGYGYGNALTAASGVYGGSTSSYTTNLGGITVRVDGAGAVNEDILARRVATYLTSELQRAQRGGRV